MGPGKHENVGKSQPVLIMIDPILSPGTRTPKRIQPGISRCRGSGASPSSRSAAWAGRVGPFLRVRVELMGSHKCRIVGKSQPVLVVINPIISTRTRNTGRKGVGWGAPPRQGGT
jgi:hypothetical protein